MWPRAVPWRDLAFGVEIEFVGGRPQELELLPGWRLLPGEEQIDDDGSPSGGELVPPPLHWGERWQIHQMLARLRTMGARANWSCGLHVHVGLEPWGEAIVGPLLDATLACQEALQALVGMAEDRTRFCPPLTVAMRSAWTRQGGPEPLRHRDRPQSQRCGINLAAWYDHGTVEIRYANGSLRYAEVLRTVELCLRFVAVAGRGTALAPTSAQDLRELIGGPLGGYPAPQPAPAWYREHLRFEEALLPVLGPLALAQVSGEVLEIRSAGSGVIVVVVESADGVPHPVPFLWVGDRWVPPTTCPTGAPGGTPPRRSPQEPEITPSREILTISRTFGHHGVTRSRQDPLGRPLDTRPRGDA